MAADFRLGSCLATADALPSGKGAAAQGIAVGPAELVGRSGMTGRGLFSPVIYYSVLAPLILSSDASGHHGTKASDIILNIPAMAYSVEASSVHSTARAPLSWARPYALVEIGAAMPTPRRPMAIARSYQRLHGKKRHRTPRIEYAGTPRWDLITFGRRGRGRDRQTGSCLKSWLTLVSQRRGMGLSRALIPRKPP